VDKRLFDDFVFQGCLAQWKANGLANMSIFLGRKNLVIPCLKQKILFQAGNDAPHRQALLLITRTQRLNVHQVRE
jgi:hypothetical protein